MPTVELHDDRYSSARIRPNIPRQATHPNRAAHFQENFEEDEGFSDARRRADIAALEVEDPFADSFKTTSVASLKFINSFATYASTGLGAALLHPPKAHTVKENLGNDNLEKEANLRAARRAHLNGFENAESAYLPHPSP